MNIYDFSSRLWLLKNIFLQTFHRHLNHKEQIIVDEIYDFNIFVISMTFTDHDI